MVKRRQIPLTNSPYQFRDPVCAFDGGDASLVHRARSKPSLASVQHIGFRAGCDNWLRRLSREDFGKGGVSRMVFYSSSVVGIAVTLLQLYNAIVLKAFWPFFAGIATLLVLAMVQFFRLVLVGQFHSQ